MEVHFQQNFNNTKNDSRDSLSNLGSMSVLLANVAKLAFCQHFSMISNLVQVLLLITGVFIAKIVSYHLH